MRTVQTDPDPYVKLAPALAGALLVIAGAVAYSPSASCSGRAYGKQLIDAMIALANAHGFAHAHTLHELLASGAPAERVHAVADIAFSNVSLSRLLVTIRRTRFHGEQGCRGLSSE